MDTLHTQINPHFLANSLNAIESLINLGKKQEASKFIIHFSRLSRQVLKRSLSPITTLEEELNTLKHFLELEKLRFRDKLTYEITIAPDLNPGMIEIPGLLLQPYVEKAIWHGIKPKTTPGFLKIQIKKEAKALICIIEDNGIGRQKSKVIKAALAAQRQSMGLTIAEEYTHLNRKLKGKKVNIIDLVNEQGQAFGTQVILRLPLKYTNYT